MRSTCVRLLLFVAILPVCTGIITAPANSAGARGTTTVRVYLIAIGDAGKTGQKIGCGDSVVAVSRHIPPTSQPLAAAIRLLLLDRHLAYGPPGLHSALRNSRLVLKRATIVHGRAKIYLSGRLSLGGVCDSPRVKAQLERTALQFPAIHSVAVFVNGIPLQTLLHG